MSDQHETPDPREAHSGAHNGTAGVPEDDSARQAWATGGTVLAGVLLLLQGSSASSRASRASPTTASTRASATTPSR
ncbi:hypothetical protein OIM90_16360 [Streptomyces sp. AD16]|nr:hypothetical protein NQP46_16075 [Streptomyces albus]WDV32307.1 hypothetical protein OIM90_16360 [Streptomyces sp. AD16]